MLHTLMISIYLPNPLTCFLLALKTPTEFTVQLYSPEFIFYQKDIVKLNHDSLDTSSTVSNNLKKLITIKI